MAVGSSGVQTGLWAALAGAGLAGGAGALWRLATVPGGAALLGAAAAALGLAAGAAGLAHGWAARREHRAQVRAAGLATDLGAERAHPHELAAALARAEAATRAKSRFLAHMSHEIRTPLDAILGLVRRMRHEATEPVATRRLAQVEDASQHLLALIDDILDLSRVEAGKLALAPRDIDLPALLERVQALLAGRAAAKGLTLALQAEGLPRRVHADPTRLTQVLLNLAGNAVKFTEQGQVTLSARCLDGAGDAVPPQGWRVRFEVADTGPGIAPAQWPLLFAPFEQGDASTARRHGGSGLGLAISRQVVALLGGEITVDSRPGEGARFRFDLTLPPPQDLPPVADAAPAQQALRARHAGRRVLLVEDNPISQAVAGELLQEAGLQVTLAADGAQALAQARRGMPALVLMDVHMPHMDGLATTRAWRAHEAQAGLARTPVIALTATAFAGERDACLAAGMDDHLAKPIDAPQLFAAVLRWLDRGACAAAAPTARG